MLWQTNRIKHQRPRNKQRLQLPHLVPADRVAAGMAVTVDTAAAARREGGPGGGGGGRREGGGPGGPGGGPGGPRRGKRQFFRKKKVCKFCVEKMDLIDYKRADILSQFVQERGKILPRRMTGVCARHQRWLGVAIKRARNIALLPFAGSAAGSSAPRQVEPAKPQAPTTPPPAAPPATPAPPQPAA